MLNDHAPIVSLLQEGDVKIEGDVQLEEEYESRFSNDGKGKTILSISSGTVEMKNNHVIVLAD